MYHTIHIYHSIFFAIQHHNYLVIVMLNRLCENNVELEKCIYNHKISKEVVIYKGEAVKYVDQINSDIVTIYNALSEIESISLQKKLDIYVVKSLVNHEQIIDGQNIFLDIASITDCSYRSLLLRAMLGMGDCVKIYGLSGYIFNINGDLNYVQD